MATCGANEGSNLRGPRVSIADMTFAPRPVLPLLVCASLVVTLACSDDTPAESEGPTSTSAEGDGDGDPSTSTEGDGDGDPGVCEPPADAAAFFFLDGGPRLMETDWDLTCTSAEVQANGDSWLLDFVECTSQSGEPGPAQLALVLQHQPATEPFLTPGESVQLRYVERPPFLGGFWFTIRDGTGENLLLAGLGGGSLTPSGPEAPGFDFAPLSVEQVSVGCEPFEHESQCGTARRDGLRVSFDGQETTVLDGNAGFVGELLSYRVIVGSAIEFTELTCDDYLQRELNALFFMIPEG